MSSDEVEVAFIDAHTEKVTRSNSAEIVSVVQAPIEKQIEARDRVVSQLKTSEKRAQCDRRRAANDAHIERVRANTLELMHLQAVATTDGLRKELNAVQAELKFFESERDQLKKLKKRLEKRQQNNQQAKAKSIADMMNRMARELAKSEQRKTNAERKAVG